MLSDKSIKRLADDISGRGLRHPIEIRHDGLILDGQRRWLSVRLLGWKEVEVYVLDGVDADAEVEAFVLDAFNSARDASVEERVRLYKLALNVLKKRHGRPRGRPPKLRQSAASHGAERD